MMPGRWNKQKKTRRTTNTKLQKQNKNIQNNKGGTRKIKGQGVANRVKKVVPAMAHCST